MATADNCGGAYPRSGERADERSPLSAGSGLGFSITVDSDLWRLEPKFTHKTYVTFLLIANHK